MKKSTSQPVIFRVSDSLTVLLIVFLVATFFAVLLYIYPGQDFLGNMFWPLIALPGLLSLGCCIKLLMRKPILQIDANGITFFRSHISVTWPQVRAAQVVTLEQGDGDCAEYLVVSYLNAERSEIIKREFLISDDMDKTPQEINDALQHFYNG